MIIIACFIRTGATGSAVCVYRMDEIQQLFNEGSFKGAKNPAELWLPIDNSDVPTDPRPGNVSCSFFFFFYCSKQWNSYSVIAFNPYLLPTP